MAAAANYNHPKPIDPLWYRLDCILQVRCPCGHIVKTTLGDFGAQHRLNANLKLYELIERLRCSRCGAREPWTEISRPHW